MKLFGIIAIIAVLGYFWREVIQAYGYISGAPVRGICDPDLEDIARLRRDTAADGMVGTIGKVILQDETGSLRVEARGTTWMAIATDGVKLSPGDDVRIMLVDGMRLTVAPCTNKN